MKRVQRPLQELFDAMLHGKFEFADFYDCKIEENYERVGWAGRTIFRPSKRLKAFHSFLNSIVFQHLLINDRVSYAYRKGANPHNALVPHASSRAFFQTDITKFFDSVDADLVRKTVDVDETPVSDLKNNLDHIVDLCTIEGRLPIGFSTSPWISNASMKEFDDAFEAYCNERELVFTRYADDILVSAQNRDALNGIGSQIQNALDKTAGKRFVLNQSKSKLTTVGRKISALGMVILPNGQVSLDAKLKKKIEHQIYFYITDRSRLADIFGKDPEEGLRQLEGYISHVHAADPSYLEKLRRKYGSTVIDSLLHRSAP